MAGDSCMKQSDVPKEMISLSLTASYAPAWGVWEGVREMVQNWHDGLLETAENGTVDFIQDSSNRYSVQANGVEVGHLCYNAEERALVLANRGVRLGRQVLLLGYSRKAARSDVIGTFGEGLKVGTLALLRRGCSVALATRDELWAFQLAVDPHFGEKVLSVAVHARPSAVAPDQASSVNAGQGAEWNIDGEDSWAGLTSALAGLEVSDTATIVRGLRQEEWHELMGRFLFLQPPVEVVTTEQGRLLLDEALAHQFFVRGVWINTDSNLATGVDFANLRLDRDRAAVLKHSEIDHQMSSMWVRAVTLRPELLPRYYSLLAADQRSSDVSFAELYCDDDTASSIAAWFTQLNAGAVPIAAKDATSAKLGRLRSELEKDAVVCSTHLLEVLKKGGVNCDLNVLFAEAAARSKKHVPAAELSEDEMACLMHACALASAADPEHPLDLSVVDVVEVRGKPDLDQLVHCAEAFQATGRVEVNRAALSLEDVHALLPEGCLTPSLGARRSCRCREAELARGFCSARTANGGSASSHVHRRLVAHLAAEACGGQVKHCEAASAVCRGVRLDEAREQALCSQIAALEDVLSTERAAHRTSVTDLQGRINEAMREIDQHEFKVMDVQDGLKKQYDAELLRLQQAVSEAEKAKTSSSSLQEEKLCNELIRKSQQIEYLQQNIESLKMEVRDNADATERQRVAAADRERGLRAVLARRTEMLLTLQANIDQGCSNDKVFKDILGKLRKDMEEERRHVCCVCIDAAPNTVLLPCRHQHLCQACAAELSRCPICRQSIESRIEVFQ